MVERDARLNIRLPAEVMERLRLAAAEDRRTVTAAVEKAIVIYCEQVERERGEEIAA